MTPQLLSSSDIIMCSNSYDNSKSNVCPILQRLLGLDTQCHLAMDSPFIKQRPHLSRIRSRSKRRPFNRQLVNYGPVLLSLLVYLNTLRGDFVHDDIPAIVNNPDVNGKHSVLELFSNDFWGEPMSSVTSHKSYRPLTILLFRLNYFLGHGKSWPFHGTNLMLHGCATILLGCICNQVLQMQKLTCLITASLFAVHPIHTEAVSGLVGCADLLACNLTLMSFLAYTKYLENPSQSVKWHWLSLCAASGAVLSKETGIMALAINIGYGLWFKSKWAKKMKQVFWADVLTLTVLLSVRWIVQNSSLPEFSVQDNPAAFHKNPLTRTLTFLYLPVHNFWLLVCPNALSYDWQMGSIPLVHSFQDPRAALALPAFYGTLLLAAMSILYQRYGSKSAVMRDDHISNCLVVAYLFMILPFVPASNLFFPVGFVIAERILYLPSIGFCLLVALGLERWILFIPRMKMNLASRHVLLHHNQQPRRTRSSSQSSMSSTSSVSSAASSCSTSTIPCGKRRRSGGAATKIRPSRKRLRKEATGEAMAASDESVTSTNIYLLALFFLLLGIFAFKTWSRNHDWNTRKALFKSGLKTQPWNAKMHYNFGNVLKEEGQTREAIKHYKTALRLWPDYVLAHNNLATLLENHEEALHHLKMALNIDPWHQNSLYNMGVLYRERGDCSRAIPLLEKCISLEPNYERAYTMLSDCLFTSEKLTKTSQETPHHTQIPKEENEKYTSTVKYQEQMITTTPSHILFNGEANPNPSTNSAYSSTLTSTIQNQKERVYDQAQSPLFTSQDQNMASILSHLAEFYIGLEKWTKAETILQRILKQDPEHDVALYQLSQVYLEQNQTILALECIKSAAEQSCRSHKKNNKNNSFGLDSSSTTSKSAPRPQSTSTLNWPSPSTPGPPSTSCIWGAKCTTKAQLCTQIIIQEADILRAMRRYKSAAQRYRLALEMSPPYRQSELLLNLGSVHHAMGEFEAAEKHYTQCLKLEPHNQVVIDNMKLLELKHH